jgi:uncharacterized protein YigE (DUF2233 family)
MKNLENQMTIEMNKSIKCLVDYWGAGFNHKRMKPVETKFLKGVEYNVCNVNEEENTLELWDKKGKIGTYKFNSLSQLWNNSSKIITK